MRPLSLVCASLACMPLAAQEPNLPVIRSSTQEVLLDAVVRDKKERLIRNLKPEEIRVLEDGVPQKLQTFRFTDTDSDESPPVAKTATGGGASAVNGPALNPLHNLNIVTIVFERMGPRSRLFAQQAASEFLANEFRSNTYGGIFSLDFRLNALQPYTNDQNLLRQAIARATTGNYTEFRKDSENVLNNLAVEISGSQAGVTIGPAGGADPFQSAGAATQGAESTGMSSQGQMALARLVWKQMEMVNYGAGWRSLDGLLSLVQAQAALPGRKTVLLLSEGLVVPWAAENMFRAIIGAANRANVSIYCVDVTGLSVQAPAQAGTDLLGTAARISQSQSMTASGDAAVDMFKQDETVNMSLHANPQATMEELAESTGGFLIANTNDTAASMHRVMEDVRAHYELSYVPTSQNYDGHFRKIEVQVKRAGAQVHTRAGYFALPLLAGEVLQPFEMAALDAMNAKPKPAALAYRAQAVPFRAARSAVQYSIVFQVPMQNLSYLENKQTAKLRSHISLLALVKDADGQVAAKVSRDLANDIPADKFDAFTRGDLTFEQPILLAPGRYTLETAVVDRENGAASAKRAVLVVSDQPGIGLSDPVPVRRVDPFDVPADGGRNPADPLHFAGGKVTPSLDGVYAAGTEIPLYTVVYPSQTSDTPRISIEVLQDGKVVSSASPALPPPDQTGAIPFMSGIQPPPGQYEIRVTARQGSSTASRMIALRVQ
ncbi:MAG TPA: VWA domain-containing protein [Bryobacteraceae bacterium]|nr:VWA domain-containing protein [Bryobacteraceae bacterium]